MMPTSFPEVPGAIIAANDYELCGLDQSIVPQKSARHFLLCVAGFGSSEDASESDVPTAIATDPFKE